MENATYNNLLFRTLVERRAIKAAIPVSPFGSPIQSEPWEVFREETGVAVIIDSAAAFDTIRATSVPAVVNLHATKVLGVGEGGFVFSTDTAFIEEVHKRANFSFWNSREATVRAMNGKISEYAAAVSLAALDDWPARRGDYARVASAYRETFTGEFGIVLQRDFALRRIRRHDRAENSLSRFYLLPSKIRDLFDPIMESQKYFTFSAEPHPD